MGDPEILVEDIERIDFDQYTVYDKKLKDWRRDNLWDWNSFRFFFTHSQDYFMGHLHVPPIQCNEIVINSSDRRLYEAILDEVLNENFRALMHKLNEKCKIVFISFRHPAASLPRDSMKKWETKEFFSNCLKYRLW